MAQMKVMVVDERMEPIRESYVVRLGGWTMQRYLQEAPESLRWEFVLGFFLDAAWLFQDPLPPAADCLQAILHG
jgi:hypothetical protein